MIEKEEIEKLAKLFLEGKLSELSKYEAILWISWLDQRGSFREFRIVEVEEDFKVLCTYGIKICLTCNELKNIAVGIEIADKYFISAESATLEDWKTFIERIVEEERPRIIPDYSFRKRWGLPDTAASFEIYVLSIDKRSEEGSS